MMTLPPYLFFYGIPEWLIMQMIPMMFRKGQEVIEKIPQILGNAVSWLADKGTQLLSSLIKPFAVGKQVLEDFLKMMMNATQALRSSIMHGFNETAKFFAKPFVLAAETALEIGKWVAKTFEMMQETIASGMEKGKEKIQELVAHVEKGWNHVTTYVKQIAQPVIDWSAQQINFINEVVKNGANWLGNTAYKAAEKVKEKLMPPIEKTIEMTKQMAHWTSQTAYVIAKPAIDWYHQNWERIKHQAEKVSDFASGIYESVKESVDAGL